MKKILLILFVLVIAVFAGCKIGSNTCQLSDYSSATKTEAVSSYSFDDEIINEEINSTYTALDTPTYFCEEVASESEPDDESVNLDTKIIENFFLGVWKADNEHEFMIGENAECDALDFFNNYGLIKKAYLTDNSAVIVCENFISDRYRIETKFDDPNTVLFYDEYELSRNDNYMPRKYTRIDDAKMYSDTGIINGYIMSLLWFNFNYLEFDVNIMSYSNDIMYFDEISSSGRFVILKSYSDNKLVFVSSFVDIADEKSQDIVIIEYEKIKVNDEWFLGDWKIIDEEELIQF